VSVVSETNPDLGIKGMVIKKVSVEKGRNIKLLRKAVDKIVAENRIQKYVDMEKNIT